MVIRLLRFASVAALLISGAAAAPIAVTTHHNDALRTGWNAGETILTPSSVGGGGFKLLRTVPLDDQVDAAPLIVPGQAIAGQGTHDVAYVVTENDTIYAIDVATGAVLLTANFGTPVPRASLPGTCNTTAQHVGINSTPVIDLATRTLYLIAFTIDGKNIQYRIHALDLSTLADRVPPPVIAAKQRLIDGSTLAFLAGGDRQRSALLLSQGAVYAGFGSFCDIKSDLGRGWVMRWQTGSLASLRPAELLDRLASAPNDVFLSAVWMSGSGLAADPQGHVYFVTGNSDQSGTTYNSKTNLAESAVKLSPHLDTVKDFFTPFDVATLDMGDLDFGAGGALLLPPQPGAVPNLAVAAGKDGQMYVMNRDKLGGYTPGGPDQVLQTVQIGPCWCGQSFFMGADGIGRVVSSGGSNVIVWKVQTSPTVALVQESTSAAVASRHNHGFFTTISSNGTSAGSAIVWAAAGPVDAKSATITLYAFDASSGSRTLFSAVAGNWPNPLAAANTVPVVANGQVFVASYKQLAIFGLGTAAPGAAIRRFPPDPRPVLAAGEHDVFGVAQTISGDRLVLKTRTGAAIGVDPRGAVAAGLSVEPVVGGGLEVRGTLAPDGRLAATTILRVPDFAGLWPEDR